MMKKNNDFVTIQILRSNPQEKESPHLETYQVPLEEKCSVMNALTYIYENIDPSLAFYCSCRIGKCMGCQVMVNGKAVFACTTPVRGDLKVEPMHGFDVIKDLVVMRGKVDRETREAG